jgi:hypothetical protein
VWAERPPIVPFGANQAEFRALFPRNMERGLVADKNRRDLRCFLEGAGNIIWLMMMRWRRASNAVSRAVVISRCAVFCGEPGPEISLKHIIAGIELDAASYSVVVKLLDGSDLKFSLRALFQKFFDELRVTR